MRPALKSGLLPVWRDRDTLQIGIDPRRAIALSGMGQAALLVGLLDGSRDREQVIAAAARQGIPAAATERVLTLLAAGGALDDYQPGNFADLSPALRARLAPELATSSLAHRDGDGGARALARRRNAVITIEGEERIGSAMAGILDCSGVGEVRLSRPARGLAPGSSSPPGPGPVPDRGGPPRHGPAADSGSLPGPGPAPRRGHPPGPGTAARDRAAGRGNPPQPGAAARSGRSPARQPAGPDRVPDLVVLAGRQPPGLADELTRQRVPHLAVLAGEAIGVVGPLVLPGQTACLRCLDYVRAGNDPAWPLILAQLGRRVPEPAACDAVLAAAVAAQAAAQALIALDRAPLASAAVNATLELVLPDWRWRRRTWPRHPACLCAAHSVR